MKKIFLHTAAIAALCLAAASTVHAQYVPPNPYQYQYQYQPSANWPFYLGVDLGGVIMQDMKIKNLGTTVDFDPGVRGDIIFGYQFIPPLAVEFETGTIWNRLSSVNGLELGIPATHADLYQIPFLGNLVFRAPLSNSGLSIYVGAGAGGVASELDLTQYASGFFNRAYASDTDFTFAYQGKCGVTYAIAPNMEVGVGYKFLGTLDHSWFSGNPALYTNGGPAYSHSFLASFNWRF